MTRGDEVVAWADEGTKDVLDDLLLDHDIEVPLNLGEVMAAIRAAYAWGYVEALKEPEPSTIREAMERETILSLLAGFS